MKSIQLIVIAILLSKGIFAQNKTNSLENEQKRVDEFFSNHSTGDTNIVYSFAFKAIVKRDDKGATKIISLSANDSVAYKIYPGYKFLNTINYGLLMQNRKQATFIFPVSLQIGHAKKPHLPQSERSQEKALKLFYIGGDEQYKIEDRIYFRPFLQTVDKTIYD